MKGIPAGSGSVAFGSALLIKEKQLSIDKAQIQDVDQEIGKLRLALEQAASTIQQEKQGLEAEGDAAAESCELLEAHEMMLLDEEAHQKMEAYICQNQAAASLAADRVFEEYKEMFDGMEDEYLKARAADCVDVKNRIIEALQSGSEAEPATDMKAQNGPFVLVAKELFPSVLLSMDRSSICGLLTEKGSKTSHIAILARSMGVPAIISGESWLRQIQQGDEIILNGETGDYVIRPSSEEKSHYEKRAKQQQEDAQSLQKMIGKESVTQSGRKVRLLANIGSPDDIPAAKKNDAEGIGLFRSEFLFMDRPQMPDEEEQYNAYKAAAEAFVGKEVIIRTLDAGGDKNIPYFNIPKEDNPFLGYRAIRLCLGHKAMFKIQLRALLRANAARNIKIMLPLICKVQEIQEAKQLLQEAAEELKQQGLLPEGAEKIPVGIMIETPAAVMISDQLAKEADFFSIGTNDLIQYTLAADRTNERVADLYDLRHPAIRRMIQMTIENGHKSKIPVGLCGEAGSDDQMLRFLLEEHIDEISMSPGSILKSRAAVRSFA